MTGKKRQVISIISLPLNVLKTFSFNAVTSFNYSITCLQRPLKGNNKNGLLQQVVFKCRFCSVDLIRVVVSEQWSLKAGGLLIQVISNTGLIVFDKACFMFHQEYGKLCRRKTISCNKPLLIFLQHYPKLNIVSALSQATGCSTCVKELTVREE